MNGRQILLIGWLSGLASVANAAPDVDDDLDLEELFDEGEAEDDIVPARDPDSPCPTNPDADDCWRSLGWSCGQAPENDAELVSALGDLEKILGLRAIDLDPRTLSTDHELRDMRAPVWGTTSAGDRLYDIPLSADARVEDWIRYISGRGRDRFAIWLARLTRFAPVFVAALQRKGLPQDVVFLAMIESGFSSKAYSFAHAVGYWQFMAPTARRFGLAVDFWLDERRDFERSADAAADYLATLFREFGDWHLAFAAYNAGEGRVRGAMRRTGSRDFWRIAKTSALRRETRQYVPKLLAAAIVAKDPGRYGFGRIEYQDPFDFERVEVSTATDLTTVAAACGVMSAVLEDLNPSLVRHITPPGQHFSIRVPFGVGPTCRLGLERIPPSERRSYRLHRLRPGDTIESIAKANQTSPQDILQYNKVVSADLKLYDALIVPIPIAADPLVPIQKLELLQPFVPGGDPVRIHRVRAGDSLWRIARMYGVSIRDLRVWNGLTRSALSLGQKIRILRGHS